MTYIHPDKLIEIRKVDLLSYLRMYEPENLVRLSSGVYCTREHDSLKISNGKWYWWSRGIGGVSALDYLIKVKGHSFLEAANMLLIEIPEEIRTYENSKGNEKEGKELLLPKRNRDENIVKGYLLERGIDESIIDSCIEKGILYESREHHNAVFIGKDEKGKARYANMRGTLGEFKGEAYGSDKRYSFRLLSERHVTSLHLFESAIDLLSYATYMKHMGMEYRNENLLSLAGVYQPKKEIEKSKIPVALSLFLEKHEEVDTIYLHLDNDKTGRICTKALTNLLEKKVKVVDMKVPIGKDVNDFLLHYLGKKKNFKEKMQGKER